MNISVASWIVLKNSHCPSSLSVSGEEWTLWKKAYLSWPLLKRDCSSEDLYCSALLGLFLTISLLFNTFSWKPVLLLKNSLFKSSGVYVFSCCCPKWLITGGIRLRSSVGMRTSGFFNTRCLKLYSVTGHVLLTHKIHDRYQLVEWYYCYYNWVCSGFYISVIRFSYCVD